MMLELMSVNQGEEPFFQCCKKHTVRVACMLFSRRPTFATRVFTKNYKCMLSVVSIQMSLTYVNFLINDIFLSNKDLIKNFE